MCRALSGAFGEYDREALEAAVQLRDSVGGKVTVLTVGGDEVLNSKLKSPSCPEERTIR